MFSSVTHPYATFKVYISADNNPENYAYNTLCNNKTIPKQTAEY